MSSSISESKSASASQRVVLHHWQALDSEAAGCAVECSLLLRAPSQTVVVGPPQFFVQREVRGSLPLPRSSVASIAIRRASL